MEKENKKGGEKLYYILYSRPWDDYPGITEVVASFKTQREADRYVEDEEEKHNVAGDYYYNIRIEPDAEVVIKILLRNIAKLQDKIRERTHKVETVSV